MIDEEVELALREIRERVVSQPLAVQRAENGSGKPQPIMHQGRSGEAIARLNANLTTTARAWDRLPPVFSNRTGSAARFERWIKARLKTVTRWFTWEQVNFNAAVHHALGEAAQTLSEQDAAINVLQSRLAELESENVTLRAEVEIHRDDVHSLRAQIQADKAKHLEQQREINSLRAEARGEIEALRIELADRIEAHQNDGLKQIAGLAEEIRDVESEHRVSFKQLSLEINEYAGSLDRANRASSNSFEAFDQRIRKLEDTKTPSSKS